MSEDYAVATDQALSAERQDVAAKLAAAELQHQEDLATIESQAAEIEDLKAQIPPTPDPDPPPETPALDVGVYRPSNNDDLDTWASGWNLTAQTFYMSHWQRGVTKIETALKKGRDVFVTIDTKDEGGATFTSFSNVAAGKIDSDINYWRGALADLKVKYPGRQIHVSIAHEAEIPKRNSADTASSFIAMTHRFSQMMRSSNSGLKIVYWAASGTTKSFYGDATDFDFASADRYKKGDHPLAETMTGTYQPWIDTLNAVGRGWEKLPRGITETGIVVNKFVSAAQIAWWQSASDAVKNHNLSLLIAFMSDRDLTYVPTDDAVKAAMKAEFASLG